MIKKYNQFIKENIQNIQDQEEVLSDEDLDTLHDEMSEDELIDNEYSNSENDEDIEDSGEELVGNPEGSMEEEMEEEGGAYKGQLMMHELSDELGCPVGADGAIVCKGKKINFFSETEMFHVDRKKFKTIEEVVDYVNGDSIPNKEKVGNELVNKSQAQIQGQAQAQHELEIPKLESKSYKDTRKFKSFRRK